MISSLDRAAHERLDLVERLLDRSIGTQNEVISGLHLVERLEGLDLRAYDAPGRVRASLGRTRPP
jgi:hypothetical protein